jgi:tRNA threonylcarbamoyladenosine biosynthesis protein TsaE
MSTPSPSTPSPTGKPDASLTLLLDSLAATHRFGRRLGAAVPAGQVIALSGELGAGKTTLTQGIAEGLGITARVTSPTFTLINQYRPGTRRLLLVHIDTYRLGDDAAAAQNEALNLGIDEILNDAPEPDDHSAGAVVVIEWAERIRELLPPTSLYIHLEAVPDDENARHATISALGPEVEKLRRLLGGSY